MQSDITFNIPLHDCLWAYLLLKLVAASVCQRYYVLNSLTKAEIKLSDLVKHFAKSYLFQPESFVLWAMIWPLLAIITWEWNPKFLLPKVILDYYESQKGVTNVTSLDSDR